MEKERKEFVAYEYKEIRTESDKVSFLLDAYENFGWERDENLYAEKEMEYMYHKRVAVLRLKRNRKIMNKAELTRLQRNFEACVDEIDALESAKTAKATAYALVIGVLGTAFMAGSVFAVTAQPPRILLCILLAIPAFSGWVLPYFVYQKIRRKQTGKFTPLIEQKYDEICEICEKGNHLLGSF